MKKLLKTSTLIAFAGLLMASTAASARTYKLATVIPKAGNPESELMKEMAKRVKKRTHNKVKIKIFWSSTLGSQNQYMQQVKSGVIDLGFLNSAALENIDSSYGVLNLPYMFRSLKEYGRVMNSSYVQKNMFALMKPHGFQVLGYFSNGFRGLYTVSKPIHSFEDVKGLKLRTMSSETYIKMLKLMGAVPTPMSYGDVYSGLQQGMIDGAEGGLGGLWELKWGETVKYATSTDQTRLTDFIVVSNKAIKKMGRRNFNILKEEMQRVSKKSLNIVDRNNNKNIQLAVKHLGLHYTKHVDKTPFINAMKPLYQEALADQKKNPVIKAIFKIEHRSFD